MSHLMSFLDGMQISKPHQASGDSLDENPKCTSCGMVLELESWIGAKVGGGKILDLFQIIRFI